MSIVFSDFAHTGRPWNRSSKNSSTARWILAPFFLGLSLALLALALKFFHEVWHVLPHVFELSESDLILSLLSMVDMGLVGENTLTRFSKQPKTGKMIPKDDTAQKKKASPPTW